MSNKENEKLTNFCEDSNSKKINDEGRRILETAANALNSGNPDGRMNFRKFNNKGENIMINNEELMEACEKGELEKVKSIIEKGIDIDLEYNNWTPLTKASEKGHLNIVKYLVENGAKINKENGHDWTALMCASMNGHSDIVEYLVENGAGVNIKNEDGHTALILVSNEDKEHLNIIQYLVDNGADINIKNNDGDTALIIASKKEHLCIIKYLIYNKADVNVKDNCDWTALMYILKNKQSEENNQLIENSKSKELIDFFIEKGGSIDLKKYHTKDKDKMLPLYKFIAGTINDIIRNDGGNLKKIKDLVDNGKNDYMKKIFKNVDEKCNNEI